MLPMEDGTLRKIREVRAGDKLIHVNVVTATVVVSSAHLDMVRIKAVLVSGNHKVSYFNRWISARTHPLAVRLTKEQYAQPVVYCLNTSTKTIECGGMVWLDWDELHGEMLKQVLKKCSVYLETPFGNLPTTRSIHAYLDGGYAPDTRVKLKSGNGWKCRTFVLAMKCGREEVCMEKWWWKRAGWCVITANWHNGKKEPWQEKVPAKNWVETHPPTNRSRSRQVPLRLLHLLYIIC